MTTAVDVSVPSSSLASIGYLLKQVRLGYCCGSIRNSQSTFSPIRAGQRLWLNCCPSKDEQPMRLSTRRNAPLGECHVLQRLPLIPTGSHFRKHDRWSRPFYRSSRHIRVHSRTSSRFHQTPHRLRQTRHLLIQPLAQMFMAEASAAISSSTSTDSWLTKTGEKSASGLSSHVKRQCIAACLQTLSTNVLRLTL